jgi:monoamine oxidase
VGWAIASSTTAEPLLPLSSPLPPDKQIPPRAEIVVVGGGLAGLSAAIALTDHGRDVVLLEARERVGGRVWTVREPFDDDLHAEAGAEYINAGHEHVMRALDRFGIAGGQAPSAPRVYSFLGREVEGSSVARFGEREARDARLLGTKAAALGRKVTDPEHPWDSLQAEHLDARSVADWLDAIQLSPITRRYLDIWHRLDYSTENSRISLLQFARDDRLYRSAEGSGTGRPREGMDALPRAMHAALGSRVKLGTRVTGIHHHDSGVTLEMQTEGRVQSLNAGQAIIAIPATVLRQIPITPNLPDDQRQAVHGLQYGTVVKVMLQFSRRFWLSPRRIRGMMTDRPFLSAWDATRDQPGERGIMGTYTGGEFGRRLLDMDNDERIAWCVSQLEEVLPGAREHFERGVCAVWDRDPFTQGTYSYFAPGEMSRFAPVLARPCGRLHFAGEHTDPWQATMNGAISSGLRAASEILTPHSIRDS